MADYLLIFVGLYQKRFFSSSVTEFSSDKTKAYEFGDLYDMNRNKAFIDKLILHLLIKTHLNQLFYIDCQLKKLSLLFQPAHYLN